VPPTTSDCLEAAEDALIARMPMSKSRSIPAAAPFKVAVVSSLTTRGNALNELLSADKMRAV